MTLVTWWTEWIGRQENRIHATHLQRVKQLVKIILVIAIYNYQATFINEYILVCPNVCQCSHDDSVYFRFLLVFLFLSPVTGLLKLPEAGLVDITSDLVRKI